MQRGNQNVNMQAVQSKLNSAFWTGSDASDIEDLKMTMVSDSFPMLWSYYIKKQEKNNEISQI